MLDFSGYFSQALPYDDFLSKYGSASDQSRWSNFYDTVKLTDEQVNLLGGFKREMRVLCMAGAWCGDCVQQCPILRKFEEASSTIQLRFIDRDFDQELNSKLRICGGARVPQVVFLNENDASVGWYGDRTLTRYRKMASMLLGDSCASGIPVGSEDPTLLGVIQDWLDEFERIQLILRLSPSLRQKHGD